MTGHGECRNVADPRSTDATPVYWRISGPAYRGDFVDSYNRFRPQPPADLIKLLLALAPQGRPTLVVDLGCGTGMSTVAWATHADCVVGVDLNPEMLRVARRADNVKYRCAPAHATRLPDGCADVVTCAQAFHWMERETTVVEAARLLRPGGVFAVYDYDWPPLVDWQVDAAFFAVLEASGIDVTRPEKADHLEVLSASGCFRHVREFVIHAIETASAERIVGLPLVFGPVARRLADGATNDELRLDELHKVVERRIGDEPTALWWSYRIRAAEK
jgi:ubiquinone/menaquinone biosynthesis C-methylase UbiE